MHNCYNLVSSCSESKRIKSNVTQKQCDALNELTKDENIIKEADELSAIVILNKKDYKELILNIIEDAEYYHPQPNYKQNNVMKKLRNLVRNYEDSLTEKKGDYIINFECKSSNLYGLPKVHKSKFIQQICKESLNHKDIN